MVDKITLTKEEILSRILPIQSSGKKWFKKSSFPVNDLTIAFSMNKVKKAQVLCYWEAFEHIALNFNLSTSDKRFKDEDFSPIAMLVNENSASIQFKINGHDKVFELSLATLIPRFTGGYIEDENK